MALCADPGRGAVAARLPDVGSSQSSGRSCAPKASQSWTWRYEFYETYDLPSTVEALNPILDSFQHLYNHHRPHGALAGQTPAACLAKRQAAEIAPSHT